MADTFRKTRLVAVAGLDIQLEHSRSLQAPCRCTRLASSTQLCCCSRPRDYRAKRKYANTDQRRSVQTNYTVNCNIAGGTDRFSPQERQTDESRVAVLPTITARPGAMRHKSGLLWPNPDIDLSSSYWCLILLIASIASRWKRPQPRVYVSTTVPIYKSFAFRTQSSNYQPHY